MAIAIRAQATRRGGKDRGVHRLGPMAQMAVYCVPNARGDYVLAALRAYGDAAVRGVLAEGGETCGELLLKTQSHRFKPVLGGIAGKAPAEGMGRVHIHDDGDIRFHADHQVVQGIHGATQIATCGALVHTGRICETITDDNLTSGKCGADRPLQMVATRGCKQQNLGLGGPASGITFNQQTADFFRTGGPAGFTGQDNVMARLPQAVGQHPRLGGLAGPIDALKAYKHMVSTVR